MLPGAHALVWFWDDAKARMLCASTSATDGTKA